MLRLFATVTSCRCCHCRNSSASMALSCQKHAAGLRAARQGHQPRSRIVVRVAAPTTAAAKTIELKDVQFINPMWGQPKR